MTIKKSRQQLRKEDNAKEERIKIIRFSTFFGATALHLILFFTVAFDTLIPAIPLVIVYIAGTVLLSFIVRQKSVKYSGWIAYAVFPLAVNVLLVLNYLISWPESVETYKFSATRENVQVGWRYSTRTEWKTTTAIVLEKNRYNDYFGIRVFKNVDEFYGKTWITYRFNRGILGLKVLRDYEFK